MTNIKLLNMANSEFSHIKWCFSAVLLVYQRAPKPALEQLDLSVIIWGTWARKKLAMLHWSECWHIPKTVAKPMGSSITVSLSVDAMDRSRSCNAIRHSWPEEMRRDMEDP